MSYCYIVTIAISLSLFTSRFEAICHMFDPIPKYYLTNAFLCHRTTEYIAGREEEGGSVDKSSVFGQDSMSRCACSKCFD